MPLSRYVLEYDLTLDVMPKNADAASVLFSLRIDTCIKLVKI